MEVLQIKNISKNYFSVKALINVSFDVPKNSVFGILGPNGSGKTTLLGIITDVLKATSGDFLVFGDQPSGLQRKKIGTLLETPNFYHYLSAVQNLKIAASIKGVSEDEIDRVLELVDLTKRKNFPFSSYSLGMKQRLAIASALLGDPEVLILDEPTNGLDPVGIAEIRELIKRLAFQGKTIIMASHLLDEVEKVCTHVAILKKGELIIHGNVNEILINEDIVAVSSQDNQRLKNILIEFPGNTLVESDGSEVKVYLPDGTARLDEINRFCFDRGIILSMLQMRKKSLESKFFELTNN
ncbi:MAG: ABC transporter ATP-binding protein [Ferruginibacter sp.]|nr:ABC transporter ATP-binding protein [Ferruginibacter sp.]